MLGQAHRYARPVGRYLVFMMMAGVIAGFGVVYDNAILIVGAMAVSPEISRSPPPASGWSAGAAVSPFARSAPSPLAWA